MKGPVYIIDEVGAVVVKTDAVTFPILQKHLNYIPGHPVEVVQKLQEMTGGDGTQQIKKYPLVALFTDILVDKNKDGFYGDARVTIIIATITEPNLSTPQRLEKNFKPILQPIKVEILEQLAKHPQFTTGKGELKYKEIEHYYWGRQGLNGNTANMFNDYIDAIELRDIQITVNTKICSTIKNNF